MTSQDARIGELEDRLRRVADAAQAQLRETQGELAQLRESFRQQQAGVIALELQCDAIFKQVFHNLNQLMTITGVSRSSGPAASEAASPPARSASQGSLDSA